MSTSEKLKQAAKTAWQQGYQHPFVQKLGDSTLDKKTFEFYLIQDYHYLLQYAKVFALGVVKSDTEQMMTNFSDIQNGILKTELALHRSYMKSFGISIKDVEQSSASLFNKGYTANMISVGQTGDIAELLATLLPCPWTYYDYACQLKKDYADKLKDNFYKSWIELYSSDEFYQMFAWMIDALDELSESKTKEQLAKLEQIFIDSIQFEYLFWDMAYKQELTYALYENKA